MNFNKFKTKAKMVWTVKEKEFTKNNVYCQYPRIN